MSGRQMRRSIVLLEQGRGYVWRKAEMYIKIIDVQLLSYKILIIFCTWPVEAAGQCRACSKYSGRRMDYHMPCAEIQPVTSSH